MTSQRLLGFGRRVLDAALMGSAVCLGCLVLFSVFGRGAERSAVAGDSVVLGEMTLLTTTGPNEDIVGVVDSASERLLLYRLENRERLEYVQSLSLKRIFVEGRATYGGR